MTVIGSVIVVFLAFDLLCHDQNRSYSEAVFWANCQGDWNQVVARGAAEDLGDDERVVKWVFSRTACFRRNPILHLVLQLMYRLMATFALACLKLYVPRAQCVVAATRCLPPDRLIPLQCDVFCSLPIIRLPMLMNKVVELEMQTPRSFAHSKRDDGRSQYQYGKILLQKDTKPDSLSVCWKEWRILSKLQDKCLFPLLYYKSGGLYTTGEKGPE